MRRLILLFVLTQMMSSLGAQDCDTNYFPGGEPYWDTYHPVVNDIDNWKHYNTHDPTVYKNGDWYYMYSTDASWANLHETGALKRRSRDLVNWEFLGNAFDGIPQSAADFFLGGYNPDYTDVGIWAPFLFQYKDKYILYYSAPGGLDGVNLAYLGYAYSESADGPWEDQGVIITSIPGDTINAIDPTVVYDSLNHQLWMAYGSWHTGLYVVELDTATGGLKTPGDRGVKVATRPPGYGLEAPELSYRNGWYYLFATYDPLGTTYNVRVGRSRNPEGPYYDFNGVDMAEPSSNVPMIQAPYMFDNHPGWQGTGHCGVYNDKGSYYMFNQGRPSNEPAMMVLHVRKIFWIDDWPVVSPERYAGVPQCEIIPDSLAGEWEHMPLVYKSSGAYHSRSEELLLTSDGSFNDNAANTWTFEDDTLILNWSNGDIQKLIVFWGWDWENNCKTLLYTGMDTEGLCIWGKKVNRKAVDNYTQIIHGASYHVTNLHSHLLMDVAGGIPAPYASVRQKNPSGEPSQAWKIKETGDNYYYLFPGVGQDSFALELRNGSAANNTDIIVNPFDDSSKQKFFIYYNDEGYFRIHTKNSDLSSAVEVLGFSVEDGANVIQWEYLGGLNQLWRFNRIDSVPLDTVSVDTFTVENSLLTEELSVLRVYPNPSHDGNVIIDLSNITSTSGAESVIVDMRGVIIYKQKFAMPKMNKLELNLPKGIFIIQIQTNSKRYQKKLVIL